MGFIRNEHGMYHRGAEKAFDQAIDSGHLGDTVGQEFKHGIMGFVACGGRTWRTLSEAGVTPYAGDYMYMHTSEYTYNSKSGLFSSIDYFKNINTREYMEVEYY